MKRFLLGLLCVMSLCGCVQAANPSFSSFATNHFITNNFLIRARLNPSQFDTNASAITITITNIAGVPGGGTLWTNDAGNYVPNTTQNQLTATNIVGVERLQAQGAFIIQALFNDQLVAGLNDVDAFTNSVILITGFDSDPANSSIRLNSGNGQGQFLVIQNYADNSGFTMRNGEALYDSAPGSFQILNGDWVTSTKGDSLLLYNNGFSWSEIGRMSGTTNNTGSSLWESVAGVLRPLGHSLGTNQFTIAQSTGWTGTGTNAFLDDGTFGSVAVINPTDRFIPYRYNAYSFEDSPWFVIATNKLGFYGVSTNTFLTVDESDNMGIGYQSLNNITTAFFNTTFGNESGKSITSGIGNTLFGHRTGRTISDGANNTLFGYAAGPVITSGYDNVGLGSSALNVNQLGYGQVAVGNITLLHSGEGGGASEPSFNTAIGHAAGSLIYLSGTVGGVTNASFDTLIGAYSTTLNDATNALGLGFRAVVTNSNEIVIGNTNNTKAIFPITTYTGSGNQVLTDDGTYKSVSAAGGLAINPTNEYIPVRINATTFADSPLYRVGLTNVATDGQVIFGPGTTNVLYRSGTDLIYTNTAVTPSFNVFNTNNVGVSIGINAGGNGSIASTSGFLYVGGAAVASALGSFQPFGSSSLGFDTSSGYWNGAYIKSPLYISGFGNGTTNYSRLVISQAGTNSPIVYNSQSTNNAGIPQNHRFDLGSTNQFAIGDGWVQLMRGMTKAEKATITPTNGMVVYQTDNTPGFRGYVNGAWVIFSTAADP